MSYEKLDDLPSGFFWHKSATKELPRMIHIVRAPKDDDESALFGWHFTAGKSSPYPPTGISMWRVKPHHLSIIGKEAHFEMKV